MSVSHPLSLWNMCIFVWNKACPYVPDSPLRYSCRWLPLEEYRYICVFVWNNLLLQSFLQCRWSCFLFSLLLQSLFPSAGCLPRAYMFFSPTSLWGKSMVICSFRTKEWWIKMARCFGKVNHLARKEQSWSWMAFSLSWEPKLPRNWSMPTITTVFPEGHVIVMSGDIFREWGCYWLVVSNGQECQWTSYGV